MKNLNIPFYLQTTKMNCGPVALKMALEFLGEKYSIEELEKLTEIKEGKAVFTIQLAIAARKLGFKVDFFTKFLGMNPENLNLDFYKKYTAERVSLEERFLHAKNLGVKIEEKTISLPEIIDNIKEDRIIILILDWNVIKGVENYQGHFVPIVGYDEENIYVHNHGFLNPTAFLPISKKLFEKARKAKGTDEDIMIIYRKKDL